MIDTTGVARSAVVAPPPPIAEVARVLARDPDADALPADDIHYLGALVARHTGLSAQAAERRVVQTHARMRAGQRSAEAAAMEAAEAARKASAYTALWLFVSLLAGAFVASLAATYGGRQRDL